MAYNIPGMFKLVQGVPPRTPRYGPVAPRPAAMPTMGFTDGGYLNIPGYDGEREQMTPEEWVGSDSLSGGGGGMPPADTVTGESIYIRHLSDAYGMTVEEAAAQWEDMTPEQRKTVIDSYFGREPGGSGSGDGLAGTYAQIAENARQFNEQMAFDRERAKQEDAVARWGAEMQRQQAMSDFTQARDAAKVARKSMFNDAATQAIGAHQAGLGQANIPGIENWRMDGGADSAAIIDRAPIIGFNPSLTYGEQLEAPAELYEPNIPGVTF